MYFINMEKIFVFYFILRMILWHVVHTDSSGVIGEVLFIIRRRETYQELQIVEIKTCGCVFMNSKWWLSCLR
jgi:hypothetical protein